MGIPMREREPPPSLDELGAQLKDAQARRKSAVPSKGGASGANMSGLGFAFRIGVELVAAVGIGAGMGLLVDRTLDTGPWGVLVFGLLGSAAGMLNVWRAANALFVERPGPRDPDGSSSS